MPYYCYLAMAQPTHSVAQALASYYQYTFVAAVISYDDLVLGLQLLNTTGVIITTDVPAIVYRRMG